MKVTLHLECMGNHNIASLTIAIAVGSQLSTLYQLRSGGIRSFPTISSGLETATRPDRQWPDHGNKS